MPSNIICIAGAHRSGTSMLTRLLHAAGLALGPEKDLMPAAADNPDGFWENLRFVRINDELLNAVGAAWDLPPWQEEQFQGDRIAAMRAKAELLVASFEQQPNWGWKDPRSCLTLRFWKSLLPDLKTLIIVRNPLEVAYSMNRRNGTSYALALRLWEIYNRRLLADTRSEMRLITNYQTFFERPEAELERILRFVGLPTAACATAATLVTKERRHTTFDHEQLIDAGVSDQVIALYNSLLSEATNGEPATTQRPRQDSVSTEPDRLSGRPSQLNLAIPESETVRRELAWRRGAALEEKEKIALLQKRIEALTQELSAENSRAALEIGRRDGRIVELQNAYRHLDELLRREQAGRNDLLSQLEKTRQELDGAHKGYSAEIARLEESERKARQDADEIQSHLDDVQKQLTEIRDRFTQTNRLLQTYSTQLADRESQTISLTARLRTELGELRRLLRFLDEIEGAAEKLRVSRRWILANPFSYLIARLRGTPLRGFGHLDRNIAKYRAWRAAHPEADNLKEAIAALKRGAISSPPAFTPLELPSASALPAETTPVATAKAIRFPFHESPQVSIVIPVFNQLRFTVRCLASLQTHSTSIPFEVIIVDDASVDETAKQLSTVPGLTYLRNESNLGFTASCNLGASRARGDYLVFLNNDTVVQAGWLEGLYDTFAFIPEAGLVGSKLIYSDGRLQEAGGIIWRDGSGWNRGKFQDSGKPEYNYLRAVDYCSAASIMLPRQVFHEIGGFDPKYSPAYYEDTDLAFKVVAKGYKVLYQPLSVAVHDEGITGGTDLNAGAKKHQEINRRTFVETWASVLAEKPANGDLESYESLPSEKKHILVIDHHVPLADRDSGSLRMSQILAILWQLGHRITFIPDNLADIPPYGDELRKRGIEFVHHPYLTSIAGYLEANDSQFDIVILSRRDFACKHIDAVRRHNPRARVIFDTVDLHFLREAREADITQAIDLHDAAAQKKQEEYDLIEEADETWVVSSVEKDFLLRERPDAHVAVVSNIVPITPSPAPFTERKDLLFIGSFQHPPNVDAVLFFAEEILPLIHRQLPHVKFYIIGDKAPPEVVALAGERVVITGYQPDVSCFFATARVSVAPLRYGAGVKGKVNQSMGLGVPVVATRIAAEGMSLTHRHDIMIADEPEAFAASVVELYSSELLWDEISRNGIEKTRSLFSVETARRQLSRLLSDEHFRSSPNCFHDPVVTLPATV